MGSPIGAELPFTLLFTILFSLHPPFCIQLVSLLLNILINRVRDYFFNTGGVSFVTSNQQIREVI